MHVLIVFPLVHSGRLRKHANLVSIVSGARLLRNLLSPWSQSRILYSSEAVALAKASHGGHSHGMAVRYTCQLTSWHGCGKSDGKHARILPGRCVELTRGKPSLSTRIRVSGSSLPHARSKGRTCGVLWPAVVSLS